MEETSPRRSWFRRVLIALNVVLIVGSVASATAVGYFVRRFGEVGRVSLPSGTLSAPPGGDPENFLLVGSDSRAFVEEGSDDKTAFGNSAETGGARADTIMLVRVDPRAGRAAMLSFPRDLWVRIAGTGRSQRINTAFNDGPEQLVETIKQNFGVSVQHYAQVDFKGFKGLVDAVGGITIYLGYPVRDRDLTGHNLTGLSINQTGCVHLDGTQALAYVRSRHFEQEVAPARWRPDPTGDLGRIQRQQDFIRRAIREALAKGLLNPARLNRLVGVGVKNVTLSKTLGMGDMIELGRAFHSLAPDTIQQYSLPVINTRHGAAATLDIPAGERGNAEQIFDVFRGVTAPAAKPVAPTDVTVRVLNGSGRPGEAGNTAGALRARRFATVDTGNGTRRANSLIVYAAGQEAKARLLARYLEPGAEVRAAEDLKGVDVVFTTGEDFRGVRAEPTSASPTTSAPATPPPTSPSC